MIEMTETAAHHQHDPTTDQFAAVLTQVLHEVPYCSASQFYEYYGDAPADPRFGKSCAWQSFEVGARLAALGGPPVRYLVDGRHVAAVVHTDDGLVVLDPYLLHTEPLRLPRADPRADGAVVATSPALPIRYDADGTARPGRVKATWVPHRDRLKLEYQRFSPTRGHHLVSRFFTLPTDSELRLVPPPAEVIRPLLVHPEQNNISIRMLDPADQQVREIIYPLDGAAGETTPARLLTRNNQGALARHGDPAFAATLGAIARHLQMSPTDVTDFVLGAADIHRRVAPADLQLPDYQVVDE